jgi:hypothetical protein
VFKTRLRLKTKKHYLVTNNQHKQQKTLTNNKKNVII